MSTVTVAIPTKNQADTIRGTLRDLEAQTRRPDRVLVADDSDDDTADVVREYAAEVGYPIDVFHAPGGVGAAREACRERAAPGLLVCLDAEVAIGADWLAEHVAIHETHPRPAVVSGVWPGHDIPDTIVVPNPKRDYFFIEANCSMSTATAERIGGWDPAFPRGCDWDFRIRLAHTDGVDAVASDRVRASPYASNSSGWLHVKKQLNRPSSVPYLRKYGSGYAAFHPLHVVGDAVGVSALAALALAVVYPPLLAWVGACLVAYGALAAGTFDGWGRLVAPLAVFALGYSTLQSLRDPNN